MTIRRILQWSMLAMIILIITKISLVYLPIITIYYGREAHFKPYNPELFATVKGSMFENFDNEIGTENGSYIVPNIIHFLFLGSGCINYVHAVCVLAAFKNHRPERVIFHTDVREFSGPHWGKIKKTLGSTLEIQNVTLVKEIFGQKLSSEYLVWHASDITRIRILMKYGGIFIDNDSYIVRSLNTFRRYEMTIGLTDGDFMGTQVLIAHKEARFLRLWLECYRDYDPNNWYYNAGQKPMREVVQYMPEVVHKVKTLFGVHEVPDRLYIWDKWDTWRKYYSIHLIIRHRFIKDTLWNNIRWPYLDESNICDYPKPFGVMAREVYSDFCPKGP